MRNAVILAAADAKRLQAKDIKEAMMHAFSGVSRTVLLDTINPPYCKCKYQPAHLNTQIDSEIQKEIKEHLATQADMLMLDAMAGSGPVGSKLDSAWQTYNQAAWEMPYLPPMIPKFPLVQISDIAGLSVLADQEFALNHLVDAIRKKYASKPDIASGIVSIDVEDKFLKAVGISMINLEKTHVFFTIKPTSTEQLKTQIEQTIKCALITSAKQCDKGLFKDKSIEIIARKKRHKRVWQKHWTN